MRLRIVLRRTVKRPSLFFPLMCVKPRKSNVSGFPSPLRFRFSSANLPNSIRRVLSGCSSNPNVGLASLYNYKNKSDLPSYEILKRTHDRWGWNFKYIDFAERSGRAPTEDEQPRQYVLPFIETVRESDIQVIRAKPVKPDSLELTVQIKFGS